MELGGIYGLIAATNKLYSSFGIMSGSINIGCNCESTLYNLQSRYKHSPDKPHHDLLTAVRHLINTLPVSWVFQHMQGHQDKHTSYL